MIKQVFLILLVSINISLFSQQEYRTIKVSQDIELIQISENVYNHVSFAQLTGFGRFSSNGLIFKNRDKAFLFDTPVCDSLTKELADYLSDSLKLKIVSFIPNHWHNDCMGGLGYLNSISVTSYANQMTIDIAKTKNLPIPVNGFKDSLTLTLNDAEVKCFYLGAAHSTDNIVVWIPSEKILFPGCMVKGLNARNLGNTVDGDLAEYPKTIKKIINKFADAKVIIPGHGQPGGRELLFHTRDLLQEK